ncbi:MAG: hypothetical protein EOO06_18065 [Chitinophagaceae bacterium]|nr:MAG: hypothetical protein EOO06_18065 [Chitinophagaceae bacterium]
MKRTIPLLIICLLLIVIAFAQLNQARQPKVLIEADDEVVIKAGKSSITMKKNGSIIIKGNDIKIEGAQVISVKEGNEILLKGSKIKDN